MTAISPTVSHGERPLVLLVEDDDAIRRSVQLLLAGRGYRVRAFAAAAPAIADPASWDAQLLLADYRLPDGDGVSLLAALRGRGWAGRAVLTTAYPSAALTDAAHAAGFEVVIEKPLRREELLDALTRSPD
jgi:CheY-like chemotaxis protein